MKIIEISKKEDKVADKKLICRYDFFDKLIKELNSKELPDDTVVAINKEIEYVNSFSGDNKSTLKQLKKAQCYVISLVEKEHKIVLKNHYRNLWLSVGMASFGIPIGVLFGVLLDNMAFIGIGLPIGLAIGVAVGTVLDKKTFEEGKQLDLEAAL